jgi:hypothetical protein
MEAIAIITSYETFLTCLRPADLEYGLGREEKRLQMYYGFIDSNRLIFKTENKWDVWLEYLTNFRIYDEFIPENSYLRDRGISP